MRIADAYFRRLLFETPAIEALSALSQEWQLRAREDASRFGLAVPEYAVTLCMIYTGEVGNGGHEQYFSNRGGRYIDDTLQALATTGLRPVLRILRAACEGFPAQTVPASRTEVDDILERDESLRARLSELDRQLWTVPSIEESMLEYLREHEGEILLPERGLDPNTAS